ncbi:MAG: competence/damage-inducible protein A [Sphingomonadales bacterium]|nr:competence/damage-inducible protein A [Sphingomonadales bacterium]
MVQDTLNLQKSDRLTTPLASIITIGDELLIGQTIDTNSAYIAQQLNTLGIWVRRRVAVGDNREDILAALREESLHSSILILTGGLGPTADDITKPLLCDYFGSRLIRDESVLTHIEHLFEKVYKRPGVLLERNRKQADVPDNCTVLHNPSGTAPGMLFIKEGVIYISLPGVPREMKDLMQTAVLPYLEKNTTRPYIFHKSILTCGIGESMLAELLSEFEQSLPNHISLAYLPNYGMVKLRLTAKSNSATHLKEELHQLAQQLCALTAEYLVTDQDISMEALIGQLLLKQNKTVATAESCTGGLIAHQLSTVAGASAYLKGSVVCYANDVKEKLLGVQPTTLLQKGAVSEETVIEMATGAVRVLQSHVAIAVSGIMGPGGGSPEKPVGTVYMAVSDGERTITQRLRLGFDRARNTHQTALFALNLLRKFLTAP